MSERTQDKIAFTLANRHMGQRSAIDIDFIIDDCEMKTKEFVDSIELQFTYFFRRFLSFSRALDSRYRTFLAFLRSLLFFLFSFSLTSRCPVPWRLWAMMALGSELVWARFCIASLSLSFSLSWPIGWTCKTAVSRSRAVGGVFFVCFFFHSIFNSSLFLMAE